ncbi:glucosaminidase domain-containing protein [bacterium]|nr:glucosaminidase domain-containing protein [bacterium]
MNNIKINWKELIESQSIYRADKTYLINSIFVGGLLICLIAGFIVGAVVIKEIQNLENKKLEQKSYGISLIQVKKDWQIPLGESFMNVAKFYNLPSTLLLAMAIQESDLCLSNLAQKNNNCFGILGGEMNFKSYYDSAISAARIITTDKRYKEFQDSDFTDLTALGKVWSEDPKWAKKVKFIIDDFQIK